MEEGQAMSTTVSLTVSEDDKPTEPTAVSYAVGLPATIQVAVARPGTFPEFVIITVRPEGLRMRFATVDSVLTVPTVKKPTRPKKKPKKATTKKATTKKTTKKRAKKR